MGPMGMGCGVDQSFSDLHRLYITCNQRRKQMGFVVPGIGVVSMNKTSLLNRSMVI